MGYARFRERSKIVLRYQTYQETYLPIQDYLTCPTTQRQRNGKTQLTKRRKSSEHPQQYWDELQAMRLCTSDGRGQLFITDGGVGRHRRYQCGDNENRPRVNPTQGR